MVQNEFKMFEKCENAYRKGNEYHKRDAQKE
jgi:hypothetical protein